MPAIYKGSLPLGYVLPPAAVELLGQWDLSQLAISAARQKLDGLQDTQTQLMATINMVKGAGVDVSEVQDKLEALKTDIAQAGKDLINVQFKEAQKSQQIQDAFLKALQSNPVEHIIDWQSSGVVYQPLNAKSVKFDFTYIPFSKEEGVAKIQQAVAQTIQQSVQSESMDTSAVLGGLFQQLEEQSKLVDFAGLFLLSAACSHANQQLIAPLVLQPKAAVSAWNALFKGQAQQIPLDLAGLKTAATTRTDDKLALVNQVAAASLFIGVLYVLGKSEQKTPAELSQLQQSVNDQMRLSGWLNYNAGKLGVEDGIVQQVKQQLGINNISTRLSFFGLGVTVDAASNLTADAANTLKSHAPGVAATQLPQTVDDAYAASTAAARQDFRQSAKMAGILQNLSTIDQQRNNTIDINMLLQAYENYLAVVRDPATCSGVPVRFGYTNVSRDEIAKAWLETFAAEEPAPSGSTPSGSTTPDGGNTTPDNGSTAPDNPNTATRVIGYKCTAYETWDPAKFNDNITAASTLWDKDWAGLYVGEQAETALGYATDYLDGSGNGKAYLQEVSVSAGVKIEFFPDERLKHGIEKVQRDAFMRELKAQLRGKGYQIGDDEPLLPKLGEANTLFQCYITGDGEKEIIVAKQLIPQITMKNVKVINFKRWQKVID